MLALHQQRYPYNHDKETIMIKMIDFNEADDNFEPICLRGKYWELIKLDILNTVDNHISGSQQ